MASMGTATISSNFRDFRNFRNPRQISCCCSYRKSTKCHFTQPNLFFRYRVTAIRSKPISAVDSGLEASVTNPDDKPIFLENAKVTVESRNQNKVQVRVDVPAKETQKFFDNVLADLQKTAPPVPGFRKQKGGKASKVPTDFLLQMLGEDRVTSFTIQEIVSSTMADYVKKENLNVKDNKIDTIQTEEELKKSFTPGKKFGFSVKIELED